MVRRQKAIADKEELTKAKARALDEKKRAEKKAALAQKKVSWSGGYEKDACKSPPTPAEAQNLLQELFVGFSHAR